MSVNLYDAAYDVEKAIRISEEFGQLKKLYAEVNSDESSRRMFENFRDLQLNLQQKQMNGEEISEEEIDQVQKTVELVQQNASITKLMEAEQRMSFVIGELNKIIMKPLEELYGALERN